MAKRLAMQHASPTPTRPAGMRWVVYWCGRVLQAMGLLLIWWVLLLFASAAGMNALLRWGMVAAVVFYAGWGCTVWARKGC